MNNRNGWLEPSCPLPLPLSSPHLSFPSPSLPLRVSAPLVPRHQLPPHVHLSINSSPFPSSPLQVSAPVVPRHQPEQRTQRPSEPSPEWPSLLAVSPSLPATSASSQCSMPQGPTDDRRGSKSMWIPTIFHWAAMVLRGSDQVS